MFLGIKDPQVLGYVCKIFGAKLVFSLLFMLQSTSRASLIVQVIMNLKCWIRNAIWECFTGRISKKTDLIIISSCERAWHNSNLLNLPPSSTRKRTCIDGESAAEWGKICWFWHMVRECRKIVELEQKLGYLSTGKLALGSPPCM